MIVGRNPGAKEDKEMRPFVGPASTYLDKALEVLGIGRDSVFITNLLKCHTVKNAPPDSLQVSSCLFWFIRELAFVQPEFIVLLGEEVFQYVLGKSPMKQHRQRFFSMSKCGNAAIMGTYHPNVALRGKKGRKHLLDDFKWLKEQVMVHGLIRAGHAAEDSLRQQPSDAVIPGPMGPGPQGDLP
jgi:DNA polymerase